jgi:hypothetical protein
MDPQKHLALNGNKFGWISIIFKILATIGNLSLVMYFIFHKMTRKKPSNPKLLFIMQQH